MMDFKLIEKEKVIKYPNNVIDKPLVSVSVVTYNHEMYIRDCLEGILMQKTDFAFEILLGEDDSKDGTRDICIEYADKYPDKIRLFLHRRENNIKIGGHPTGRFNMLYNLQESRGKYIALCEGDDYWTDPLKLQKQVDFLEANPEYSLCFHNARVQYENSRKKSRIFTELKKNNYNINDIIMKPWFIPTQSILFRKDSLEIPLWFNYVFGADYALQLILATKGDFFGLNEVMSVYRRNDNSVSSNLKKQVYIFNKTQTLLYFNYYTNFRFNSYISNKIDSSIQDLEIDLVLSSSRLLKLFNPLYYYYRIKLMITVINKHKNL